MSRPSRITLATAGLVLGFTLTLGSAWSGAPATAAQLGQARTAAAASAFPLFEAQYKAGAGGLEPVYVWSVRWFEAQGGKPAGAGPADAHLARMLTLDALAKSRVQTGMATAADTASTAFYRAEAELWAFEARGGRP